MTREKYFKLRPIHPSVKGKLGKVVRIKGGISGGKAVAVNCDAFGEGWDFHLSAMEEEEVGGEEWVGIR